MKTDMPQDMDLLMAQADRLRRYTLWSLLALLAWLAIQAVCNAPADTSPLTILVAWFIQALGLMLFLPGVQRGNAKAVAWLGYVLMMYFIPAVLGTFATGWRGQLALVECLLVAGAFVLGIRFVKVKRATQNGEF